MNLLLGPVAQNKLEGWPAGAMHLFLAENDQPVSHAWRDPYLARGETSASPTARALASPRGRAAECAWPWAHPLPPHLEVLVVALPLQDQHPVLQLLHCPLEQVVLLQGGAKTVLQLPLPIRQHLDLKAGREPQGGVGLHPGWRVGQEGPAPEHEGRRLSSALPRHPLAGENSCELSSWGGNPSPSYTSLGRGRS